MSEPEVTTTRWWMDALSRVSKAQMRVMGHLADGLHLARDPFSMTMWIIHEPYNENRVVARVQRKTIEALVQQEIIQVRPDHENGYQNRWMLNFPEPVTRDGSSSALESEDN